MDGSGSDHALTGGCMCGAVRWQLSEPPVGAGMCHCKRCQRRTGTALSFTALTVPGSFEITAGADRISSYAPDEGWEKFFCSACGSALYTRNPADPDLLAVRMGGFDEDPGTRAAFHQYTAYAPEWAPVAEDGLPRFEERVPSYDPPTE